MAVLQYVFDILLKGSASVACSIIILKNKLFYAEQKIHKKTSCAAQYPLDNCTDPLYNIFVKYK